MTVLRWSQQTWPELQELLGSAADGHHVGLVPVGAMEQHGPHLPIGTDTIVASAVCEAAGERSGAIVLPAIPVGVSYGHGIQLPGTLSLSPELLAATVRQWATWAAMSGLRRLLFVNAHLGNSAALLTATDHLRLYAPQLRVGLVDWWDSDDAVRRAVLADGADIHANDAETSLMMAIAPHLVRDSERATADDEDRTTELVFRYTAPSLSRNGVTGRPSSATAARGHKLLDLIATSVAHRVTLGRREEPPFGVAPPPAYPPAGF